MKKLNTVIAAVEKTINKSVAQYKPEFLQKIQTMLSEAITAEDLAGVNTALKSHNLRQLELADIAKVAYIHCRSIVENGGDSPTTRVIAFADKCGDKFANLHVKAATEILLAIEFMQKIGEADHAKRQCRKYKLPDDVKQRLGISRP